MPGEHPTQPTEEPQGTAGTTATVKPHDIQLAFRVVRVMDDGTLASVVASSKMCYGWAVTHKIGKWTRPRVSNSLLFVFHSKNYAMSWAREIFIHKRLPVRVYSCIANKLQPLTHCCPCSGLWELYWGNRAFVVPMLTPSGTMGAEAVKLLKQVGPD